MDVSLRDAILPVHREIVGHPFLTGLTDGSLPEEAFRRYVIQDTLFLADYARALALCAARSPETADLRMFCTHATEAIDVERALHDELAQELGIAEGEIERAEQSAACRGYTSFLLATSSLGELPVALAAILPCYWIYWEVGRELTGAGSPDPRYRRWIETYADDTFGEAVEGVIAAADRALDAAAPRTRASAGAHARVSARYEWMFWDSALRAEGWPV